MLAVVRGIVIRSADGGRTWRRTVNGLDYKAQPYGLAYAGRSGQHPYLLTGDGVFRSTTGADTWTRVLSSGVADLRVLATTTASTEVAVAAGASGLQLTTNGGSTWRAVDLGAPITAVAFKRRSSQFLIAGDRNGVLHTSYDGGTTWQHRQLTGVGSITSIAMSPDFARSRTALIGTTLGGVLRWDHTGQSSTPVNVGLDDLRLTSIAYSANFGYDRTVFASTWTRGIFVSRDAGSTWVRSSSGLTTDPQSSQPGYDRSDFGRVVSVVDPVTRATTEVLASFTGVYTSGNLGASWDHITTLATSTITGLAVSPQFGTDGSLALMTYVNAPALSSDRGVTWRSSNLGLGQPNYWRAASDRYLRGFNIAISPTVASRQWLYLASDPGVYRSSDSGASWQLTPIPGFANPRITTSPVAPRVFVSPMFATDHTVLMVDTVARDVYRSTDEGASFAKVGEVPSAVHCLQAAPTYSADRRLLACTGKGVYVSTDAGTTWRPTRSLLMYDLAITSDRGGAETWWAATAFGLHRSVDQGANWTKVALPAPAGASPIIGAVAGSGSSAQPPTLLVSTKGKGMYRSIDGGVSFRVVAAPLLSDNQQFDTYNYRNTGSPIVFSPAFATDRTIFGASHDRLWKSTDAGSTWQKMDVPVAVHSGALPAPPTD